MLPEAMRLWCVRLPDRIVCGHALNVEEAAEPQRAEYEKVRDLRSRLWTWIAILPVAVAMYGALGTQTAIIDGACYAFYLIVFVFYLAWTSWKHRHLRAPELEELVVGVDGVRIGSSFWIYEDLDVLIEGECAELRGPHETLPLRFPSAELAGAFLDGLLHRREAGEAPMKLNGTPGGYRVRVSEVRVRDAVAQADGYEEAVQQKLRAACASEQ